MNSKKSILISPTSQQRFDIKRYDRPGFTEEEINQIKEAFDIFDADG